MIKAPCLFYEVIISREMHNNWYISQNTTKKWLYINTLISFYQFMHNASMGYPDILRQTPIFCMNTQKPHEDREKSRALLLSPLNSPTSRAFSFLSLSPPGYPFFRQNIPRRPTNDTLSLAGTPTSYSKSSTGEAIPSPCRFSDFQVDSPP